MVGYKIKDQKLLDPDYTCAKCSLLLRNTIQFLECGHRHCQSCVDEQPQDHIICYQCYMKISQDQYRVDRGFQNDMQTINITCAFCDWNGLLKYYEIHLNQSHSNPSCNYCNEKFLSIDDLNKHLQLTCSRILVFCPLYSLGCDAQMSPKDLPKHFISVQHQQVLIKCIQKLKTTNILPRISYTTNQIEDINKTVNDLTSTSETLTEHIQCLRNEYTQKASLVQSVLQALPVLKQSMDNQDISIDNINRNQEPLQQSILVSQQRLKQIKLKSIDGIFIWAIHDVHEKMMAAQSNMQIFIDSPPFYSSPTGYKMCIRLCLNGDKTARGRFISLNFILMRGEFDAILVFPFCYPLIFALLDQTKEQNHIIRKFQPNVLSNNYRRPQSEMIIADEILEFVPLQYLQGDNNRYIRDNTMFIKTIIDFNNIYENLLSYTVNLGAELPTVIQQTMIEQEKQKGGHM